MPENDSSSCTDQVNVCRVFGPLSRQFPRQQAFTLILLPIFLQVLFSTPGTPSAPQLHRPELNVITQKAYKLMLIHSKQWFGERFF